MSRNRTRKDSGYCNEAALPKGPNGRNLCRGCAVEVPKGRRTFCGGDCVDAWRITTDPGFARHKVFERDKGICADCDRDCVAWRKVIAAEYRAVMKKQGWDSAQQIITSRHGRAVFVRMSGTLWDADHTDAVQEGGGLCGLEGFQTLCIPCHQTKTALHAARRAGRRMATGQLVIPGTQ